jgi:branched-chain amino acid transport system permease protein
MSNSERKSINPLVMSVMIRLRSVGLSPPTLSFFVILAILPLFIRSEYTLRLLVVGLLLGSQAMAFSFTLSSIDIINFGFAAFCGVGAYTSALLAINLGISPWIGFIAGAIVAAVLGLGVGVLTLRLRGLFAACMAWFLGLTLQSLAAVLVDLTRGYLGLPVPFLLDVASSRPYYYIILPIAILTYVVLQGLDQSNIGLACRAIGQNTEAAKASGVNPTKYKVINFTVSCALAGVLGVFHAHFVGVLTPEIMGTTHTTEVLALAYIGGRTSLWGGLLAALVIIPVFEYLRSIVMEVRFIIYGLLLISVMIFYPEGLTGLVRAAGRLAVKLIGKWRQGTGAQK